MDDIQKKQALEKFKGGLQAAKALRDSGAEDVFMDPGNWPILLQAVQLLLGFFGSLFGIGTKARELDAQFSQASAKIDVVIQRLEAIEKAIENHGHEAAELKKIFQESWQGVAEEIVAAIPGQMMRMQLQAAPMKFVRAQEDE